MLNTLSQSPAPRLPSLIPDSPPRRRGGQPSNRNTLKHGLFAVRNPTPITPLVGSLRISPFGLAGIQEILEGSIPLLRLQIARLFASAPKATGLQSFLAWHRPIISLLGLFLRVERILARSRQPLLHLQFVAAHALELIHYDFLTSGITRDADSFREKNKKSDFNSFPEHVIPPNTTSFLTSRQWAILRPLIPPPDFDLLSQNVSSNLEKNRKTLRGRPPSNPFQLLEAAFWKIAYHVRWQDLPPGSPPFLTSRRYYRRLFLGGRLFSLYSALYKDLISSGQVNLLNLVNRDCFSVSGNALVLHPRMRDDWRMRTALLLMQYAWQVSRRILREEEQSRRHRFSP